MALVSPDFRFLRANAALCRMLGYTEQELTQLTFTDITHPEDIEKDVRQARKVFREELSSYQMEKRYLTKKREVIWVKLTASLMRHEQERVLYGLGIIEDITERKR
ncbi:MAG: PAS domain S-box protein, partial [Candidatus Methylomirabilales bacterium]